VLAIQPTLERRRPLTAIDLIAVLRKLPFDLSPQEQTFLPRDSIDVDGCASEAAPDDVPAAEQRAVRLPRQVLANFQFQAVLLTRGEVVRQKVDCQSMIADKERLSEVDNTNSQTVEEL
jgi:hypothetical protein